MPGFRNSFIDKPRRRCVCPVCRLPMQDPVQIKTCGHRFCDLCLQELLRNLTMDWRVCAICQKDTEEPLRCPQANPTQDGFAPYRNFLENVKVFRQLKKVPVQLIFDENTALDDFVSNKAQWHKSCHRKFSAYNLERTKRKTDFEEAGPSTSEKRRRDSRELLKAVCIFCTKETAENVHAFTTFSADANLKQMATDLQESGLLSRIANTDLIALEAKYHLSCLTEMKNRHRSFLRRSQGECETQTEEEMSEARAMIELITYIEHSVQDGNFIFKLTDLHGLYESRLHELGFQKQINKTRLKVKLLENFTSAQEQRQGKNTVIVFEQGMQTMLKQALAFDVDEKAALLAKTAKMIRKDIFEADSFHFDAAFPQDCQQKSTPASLKMLVSMLLKGADLRQQDSEDAQVCLTISQTIVFNCKKRKTGNTDKHRHSTKAETPLPLYLGMKVHTETRSKSLITALYELGLCVSYDRILKLESQLATSVCQLIQKEGVVCPSQLRHGLFTVGALDNLDYNPSSTTAEGSFHGTAISLFQSPTKSNMGENRAPITLPTGDTSMNQQLPETYTVVPAVALKESEVEVPQLSGRTETIIGEMASAKQQENMWLANAMELLDKENLKKGDAVAWSAFHASLQSDQNQNEKQAALSQLLPLFYEKAATAAMIKHGMDVLRQATQFLNPGQVPVMAVDAPLFALAKYIQWKWPETYGKDAMVIMFGGLHAEMATWSTVGDYLKGSGWTSALVQAGIATSGTADSFLRCSHVTRTRHAHEVSALVLAKLQKEAFCSTPGPHTEEAMETWRQETMVTSPTFKYWDTILHLELLGLMLVRAHREGNFKLYVEILKAIIPWFFALDHQNYSRWMPVHVHDMESLPISVLEEFLRNNHWVVSKTTRRFSSIPIDQAHEQNNALVKGGGGAVGLTENPSAFRRWILAGPEQARLLGEFERTVSNDQKDQSHHEEGLATQIRFQKQAVMLAQTIKTMGNPFLEQGPQLIVLDTRDVLDDDVVKTVRTIEQLGQEQYCAYKESVLEKRTKSIHVPIKKNSLRLLHSPHPKSRKADKTRELKEDLSLFSRLYVVAQSRKSDLDAFFRHENHPYPPSLSDRGKLRSGTKSDLLPCLMKTMQAQTFPDEEMVDITNLVASLEQDTHEHTAALETLEIPEEMLTSLSEGPESIASAHTTQVQSEIPESFDIKVLDGTAVLHFLSPRASTTFAEYANEVFLPYILQQLEETRRLDVIWDTYSSSSLKECTREKRGKGQRREVAGRNKMPTNWQDFLRDPENKTELFKFLSDVIAKSQFPLDKVVVVTYGTKVIVRGSNHSIPECFQEEADSRIVYHIHDAVKQGASTCIVRTVDTDVVVILIGMFHTLQSLSPQDDLGIWVAFGTGKHYTHINVSAIVRALGEDKAEALPFFHAFTGTDTTSAFFGKGKKSSWEAWKCFQDATIAFRHFQRNPFSLLDAESENFRHIERFTVILYDKTSSITSVNECRKVLFCQRGKSMQDLPPTQSALLEHTKRCIYQASIWSTSHLPQDDLPSPEGWGWTQDSGSWRPVWTTLEIASKACSELVKCGCKSKDGCTTGRCACNKAQWNCTALCKCACSK